MDTQVVVVGGGATGVAVLRDLARRGIQAVLVERSDLGTGTSGRWHGLLHSGARYAVRDQESARECIAENQALRRIAPHTIEDVGGMFVLLSSDDEAYAEKLADGCEEAGIPFERLSGAEARRREPLLSGDVRMAYAVPDAGIDSWALLRSMAADATEHGARVLPRHPVIGFERRDGRLNAVRVRDLVRGEDVLIGCDWVLNAAGAWAGRIGRLAGAPIRMLPGKGVMVVMALRYVQGVVNAMRRPADGDIVVPQHEVAILGTTDDRVDDPDDIQVRVADVDKMIEMCSQMIPAIAGGRALRAFAGSRPLYKPEPPAADPSSGPGPEPGGDGATEDRGISRTFTVIDHASRDGTENMLSIVGGKLTTCRQMAEALVDRLADRMGVTTPCTTATEPLPGADHGTHKLAAPLARVERDVAYGELLCECELVTRAQVKAAVDAGVQELEDLRRKLRVGYGPCQGGFCVWRAAAMLAEGPEDEAGDGGRAAAGSARRDTGPDPLVSLERFVEERWRGQLATIWGDQARQVLLNQAIYRGIFDLGPDVRADEAVELPAVTGALTASPAGAGGAGSA
ncbi:MAG TPA: anaerobic glycerol-3-phosphate dehydrogenase subunit GlpA [Actinomycetes bacterium]|jgi:glycerol-3-phosphate dehydrogenase|nr:anaerobic glycerol-3-phosphate dehydrogenase subunit GlpA [Actinomycetes bacterium]